MRAVVINQYGGPELLQLVNAELPPVGQTELLVEVHACALNPVDFKIRCGELAGVFPVKFPHILGADVSGRVCGLGSHATDFKIGDEVYFVNRLNRNGGYAEFTAVEQSLVAKKPAGLSHVEAAALPLAALTAIQTLRDFCKLQAGQKVLIHAGAGGVGTMAIQYARHLGAEIFTTGSRARQSYLRELGADRVIDYHTEDFVTVCNDAGGMDCVLESLGGNHYPKSILATKPGGAVVCIVNPPDSDSLTLSSDRQIKTDFMLLSPSRKDLSLVRELVENGHLRVYVAHSYPLEEAQAAHSELQKGRTQGKLILQMRN